MSFESDYFRLLQEPNLEFEKMALLLFRWQAQKITVYKQFLDFLNINIEEITAIEQIPFMPVSFFKTHKIIALDADDRFCFTSSTTTGGIPSKHYVPDLKWYEWSFKNGFNHYYVDYRDFCVLGLLPNYIERGGSSLVYMVKQFIEESKYAQSDFYLNDFSALSKQLQENEKNGIPTLLLGVTYALLDFAQQFPMPLKNTIVMETGGMKGKRKELLRSEVHTQLKHAFSLAAIHSEYGMTELLSQAYSKGDGIFECPKWMRVLAADLNDARTILPKEKAGSLNLIDLANINSCAFLATDDLGVVHLNNTFEVIGRKDHSDIRGCGLMYTPV
ncbi:MAG: acyl transferase [Bacteroidetes bacterium]|nr:acyl transferase [Bacteroidota bacterium]